MNIRISRYIRIMAASAVILAAVSSCGGTHREPAGVAEAGARGEADARALCETPDTSTRALQSALLAVKAREWSLRRDQDSIVAKAYIDSFRDYVKRNNQSLARKIF